MAKCKYPNEVCANMTVFNGKTYCDSIPCSLKDEMPKQTNADRIRSMSDEELADFIRNLNECCLAGAGMVDCSNNEDCIDCKGVVLEWLQSEVEE